MRPGRELRVLRDHAEPLLVGEDLLFWPHTSVLCMLGIRCSPPVAALLTWPRLWQRFLSARPLMTTRRLCDRGTTVLQGIRLAADSASRGRGHRGYGWMLQAFCPPSSKHAS